jgi:hypothetical protein
MSLDGKPSIPYCVTIRSNQPHILEHIATPENQRELHDNHKLAVMIVIDPRVSSDK